MKFCPNCRLQSPDTATFCTKCGTRLTTMESYSPGYDSRPAAPLSTTQTVPKKKKKGWIFAAIAAALLLLLILSMLIGGDPQPNPTLNVPNSPTAPTNVTQPPTQPPATQPSATQPAPTEPPAPADPDKPTTKTIMIYIVGSDLESEGGAASADINEMIDANVDTSRNNILICTGGAKEWANSVAADELGIYYLEGDTFSQIDAAPAASMGVSDTLSSFINLCKEQYPADQYGLILWNHGGGPLVGYGSDELFNDDLQMYEIQDALNNTDFGSGEKLEFLGFDACLMGTIETAWCVKDYAKYFVASQEVEPGWGWDYSFLNQLDNCNNGAQIGTAIIDSFFTGSQVYISGNPQLNRDLTLSCLDLSCMQDVERKMNDLFSKVDKSIINGSFHQVAQSLSNVKTFGKTSSGNYYDLIDMKHMVTLLSGDYPTEAKALDAALDQMICYSKANTKHADGVSIYHPYENEQTMSTWVSQFQNFSFAAAYAEYIENYSNCLSQPGSRSWDAFGKLQGTAQKKDDGNELSIKLNEEQMKNYASSTYYILRDMGEDGYMFIFADHDAELSEDGTLSASYDNKAVFAVDRKTGEMSDGPITMYAVKDGSEQHQYRASAIFWSFQGEISDWKVDPVEWLIKIEHNEPQALGAYLIDNEDDSLYPQKKLLDYKDYDTVEFSFSTRKPKKDENGNLLPYFQWDSSGVFYGNSYEVADDFYFCCSEIENKDDYYFMFVVKDIQGNSYASDLAKLPE